jgi:arsenate reductase-like glutaredoxin family protein
MKLGSVIYLANSHHFAKNMLKNNILSQIPICFKGKKIATIAYNIKGYLRFSTFIF